MNEFLQILIGTAIGAIWSWLILKWVEHKRKKQTENAEIKRLQEQLSEQEAKAKILLKDYPNPPKPIGELTLNEIKAIEEKAKAEIQKAIDACPYETDVHVSYSAGCYWRRADSPKYHISVSLIKSL